MSSQFSLSERVLTAERDHQHIFANSLKRKLEAVGRNGFAPTEDREISAQEHEYSLTSEKSKRQRFSDNFTHDYHTDRQEMCTNGESNHFSTADNGDSCPSIGYNGNSIGADSSLQNNLEYNVSNENEETVGMDFECETVINTNGCPPNLNVVTDDVIECDSAESSPAKGSPAREFLLKHRPEYQMHCIPSYCHPGGLWDVMLEVYHGL